MRLMFFHPGGTHLSVIFSELIVRYEIESSWDSGHFGLEPRVNKPSGQSAHPSST